MLALGLVVNCRLKNTQWYFCGFHEMSKRGCIEEEKKGHFLHMGGRAILITTGTKLLGTKYAFNGFYDDLIETIN